MGAFTEMFFFLQLKFSLQVNNDYDVVFLISSGAKIINLLIY